MNGTRRTRITPFWYRLPAFFLYPFHPRSLIVLVGLAVMTVIAGSLPLFGMLAINLVATLFLTKFALDILARTAEGELDPPPLDGETIGQGYELPFKLLGIYIAIGIATFAVAMLFGWLAIIFFLLALFLLPASIMTLAFSRSLGQALSPGELFRMVRATGWGYVALLACLFLLNGGSSTALQWFGQGLPPQQLMALSMLLQYYFMFVMFNLMGYLLFQYHDRLGYEPLGHMDAAEPTDPAHATIQQFIDEENYDAAIAELKRLVQRDNNSLETRLWLHRVARAASDDRTLLGNAGGLIEDLIDAGRARDATEVYRACQDIDPQARPARASDYYPLANMMLSANEPGRVLRLANGFHRNFPDSEELPRLYLMVAQIMADQRQQPQQARKLLDFVARRFPNHPEARKAATLREALAD